MKEYEKPNVKISEISLIDVLMVSANEGTLDWKVDNVFDEDM